MFRVPRLRAPRSFVVAALVAGSVLGAGGVAAADDSTSTGDVVVGEFVQAWPEHRDASDAGADDGPLSFIRTADGGSVRVDTEDVAGLPLGATVEVTVGTTISDPAASEDGYETARDVLAAEVLEAPPVAPAVTAPATTVNHPVSVVMVVPTGGARDSTTLADVVAAVNGPVADFWSEQSNGQVNIGVTDAHDWIDLGVGCRDPWALWDAAARAVGFTRGAGRHLLVYLPSTVAGSAGCSDGLGEVGASAASGGYAYVRDDMTSIIAHELGHNMGLRHSSAVQCDRSVQAAPCRTTPYWDLYDVMGASWSRLGSLNVVQASRIYNVAPKVFDRTSAPETVTLAAVSQQAGTRAIVLRNSDGEQYWLEYRPASGRDAWLGAANWAGLKPGVLLRKATTGDDGSLLLDATPSAVSGWDADSDARLPVGTPISVNDTALTGNAAFVVTVQAVSPTDATVTVAYTSPIATAYQAAGGETGVMGPPTSPETCVDRMFGGRFCQRSYQNGGIYWNLGTGAHRVTEPMYTPFIAAGGVQSPWGVPTTDTECGLVDGGCVQSFEYRTWATSPTTGAFPIRDQIADYWRTTGRESGPLGYPTADRTCGLPAGGCSQPFQGGTVYFSSATGAHAVRGSLLSGWLSRGGPGGALGYPVEEETCGLARGGCGQRFASGWLYWSSATGPHELQVEVARVWQASGGPSGPLGYPVGKDLEVTGGTADVFEDGRIYWSAATGARILRGGVLTAYRASGGTTGPLGFPISDHAAVPGGFAAAFQGGSVYESTATGAHVVRGPVRAAWWGTGGIAGPLGFPTGDTTDVAGGATTAFTGGSVFWSEATGAHVLRGGVLTAFLAAGGPGGTLGFPISDHAAVPGGFAAAFQGGSVYESTATGAHVVSGAVRSAWWSSGGVSGPLGFPTADVRAVAGGTVAEFQGGAVYASPSTSAQVVRGAVLAEWQAGGGAGGPLGFPVSGLLTVPGGTAQAFQGGSIYSSSASGTHALTSQVLLSWWATGGVTGPFGFPVTDVIRVDGGTAVAFQGGSVYVSAATGAQAISGALRGAWWATGGITGPLGFPTSGPLGVPGGSAQAFQGGSIYSSPSTGAHAVPSAFLTPWWASGGVTGPAGFPTSDLLTVAGGTAQAFAGGSVYAADGRPAHIVHGPTRLAWWTAGGLSGPLGYPTGDTTSGGGGSWTAFAGGILAGTPGSVVRVDGEIRQAVERVGGLATVGLPLAPQSAVPGGRAQAFQQGSVYWSAATGGHVVSGPLRDAWWATGGVTGRYGFPTGDVTGIGTSEQSLAFVGGTLRWSAGVGVTFVAD